MLVEEIASGKLELDGGESGERICGLSLHL
jgi:hypothetical protein